MGDVAVTILADSSVTLKLQWQKVWQVLGPLFTRLKEGRTAEQMYLSVVTYATADHRPTPILAKRYFTSGQPEVFNELINEPQKLGFGCSGSGGRQGLSALEGYATALELYDYFLSGRTTAKEGNSNGLLCHIIHVFATKADDLVNPQWNLSTALDHTSWKTLPEELQKRNINLSLISLRPEDKFTELHDSLSPEPCKPWFALPPQPECSILLSASASWDSVKRPEEKTEANKPETPKSQQPSTPVTDKATPAVPVPPKNTGPPATQPMLLNLFAQAKQLEQDMVKIRQQYMMLVQQNRTQEADTLKKSAEPRLATLHRLRQIIAQIQQRNNANANGNAHMTNAPGVVANHSQPQSAGSEQSLPATQQQVQANPQVGSSTQSNPVPGLPGNMQPGFAAQIQKMVEREGIQGQKALMASFMQKSQQIAQQKSSSLASQISTPMPQASEAQVPINRDQGKWTGSMAWQNPQTGERMEVLVDFLCQSNIHPHLWPQNLELRFSNDRVTKPSIKQWMESQQVAMACRVVPVPQERGAHPDNARAFGNLSKFLLETHRYAAASWIRERPTILLFTTGQESDKLPAVISPEVGFFELPRGEPAPAPQPTGLPAPTNPTPALASATAQLAASLPQNMTNARQQQLIAQLLSLPPEQRQKILQMKEAYNRQRTLQALQAQARAQGVPGAGAPAPNPPWSGGSGGGQQAAGAMNMNMNMGGQLPLNANQAQMAASFGLGGSGLGQAGHPMQGIQGLQGMQGMGGLPPGINIAQALNIMQQQRQLQQQQQQQQQQQNSYPGQSGFGGSSF